MSEKLSRQLEELRRLLEHTDDAENDEPCTFIPRPVAHVDEVLGQAAIALTRPAPSEEDVEAAAKRIFAVKWMKPRPTWESLHESTREEYRGMARAALGARGS